MFMCLSVRIQEAEAAITFVKDLGSDSTKTSGTTLAITVPAAGVAAGNSIIVSVMHDAACSTWPPVPAISSITDTAGNQYILDVNVYNDILCTSVLWNVSIYSAHNVNALSSGNTITITWDASADARAASASEFSGLATSSALDKTNAGSGTGTSASSGSTSQTTQNDELLVGLVGVEGPTGDTFTTGPSYSLLVRSGTSGGQAASNVTVNPEYRVVSSTGTYSASGTLGTSRNWGALIATYKMYVAGSPSGTKLRSGRIGSGKMR